ncbi:hypothetical protein Nmel_013596 [Mimus melanotis]
MELQKMQPKKHSGFALRPGSWAELIEASGPHKGLTFINSWQLLWIWGVLIFFHPLAATNEFSEDMSCCVPQARSRPKLGTEQEEMEMS